MNYNEVIEILEEAERTEYALNSFVNKFAKFCRGRLRSVDAYTLKALKVGNAALKAERRIAEAKVEAVMALPTIAVEVLATKQEGNQFSGGFVMRHYISRDDIESILQEK